MIYLELYLTFAKIGLFTIGGGYAMIPLIQQELSRKYMSMEEIIDIIAISGVTPGALSVNAATFTGMRLYSWPGAIVSILGVITPSLVITTLIALFFFNINQKPPVQAALYGIRPAIWALILFAAIRFAQSALLVPGSSSPDYANIIIFIVVFACMLFFKKISPIVFILGAGACGAVFFA